MVTEVTSSLSESMLAVPTAPDHRADALRWRLVKRFQTLESALALMKQLQDRGQTPRLVMADGLSVVTQRI